MSARPVIVIGNPESNRVGFLQAALEGLGRSPAAIVSWREVLAPLPNPSPEEKSYPSSLPRRFPSRREGLEDSDRNRSQSHSPPSLRDQSSQGQSSGCILVPNGCAFGTRLEGWGGTSGRGTCEPIIRIESPGKDFGVERALLMLGADTVDGGDSPAARLSKDECASLSEDKGRILYPRQWYHGFCAALNRVEAELADAPAHTLMNAPGDIAVMFDKRLCHARLEAAGIPVPGRLGPVRSYNELVSRMREARWSRVFVKLAHGSSASGVVAFQSSETRCQATTTVEMVDDPSEPMGLRLYNSRRIRTYTDTGRIARLIDALCVHGVHVEQWLPKAGLDGHTLDLRVVVIAGEARHIVVRMSKSPITNLHLLNRRGDPDAVRLRMGEDAWRAAMETCERTMQCFPDSLYAGIDLLITADFKRHAVLEVNAFGDLLPGILSDGQDTYMAELLKA